MSARCTTPDVHVLEEELALCGQNEGLDTATVRFEVYNPSALLHLTLMIFVRPGPGAGLDDHDYTGETWQLHAGAEGNPKVPLNAVFDDGASPPVAVDQPLPDSYEGDSGIKVIFGIANLQSNAAPSAPGRYIVRATWEPSDPLMPEPMRRKLYALCALSRSNPNAPLPVLE